MTIEFWFEFASTYSYPAAMRIEALAASRGISISWRAFLLGPIFQGQGWNDSPFNVYPVKGQYMWRDMERTCGQLGIPLRRPTVFPRNGLLAARVACSFAEAPWLPEFVQRVYRANFAEDLEISDPAIVERCLTALGQDAAAVIAAAQTPAAKEKLRAQTAEAMHRGLFGAPSFVVGRELFWGNDRLEQALDWVASPVTPTQS
jgi:2-hydroxychromene-2-carboxylate isomerase